MSLFDWQVAGDFVDRISSWDWRARNVVLPEDKRKYYFLRRRHSKGG
jgi:hypothetical protein